MVYFIGAGPGAIDLITVRGMYLLEKADVVIYAGSLVNKELLNYASSSCEVYDSADMTLEDVIDVIVKNKDKNVVRLHTGDPSLYGAIREQIDILRKHGIPFKNIPGVSSFSAAAATLNAEYTLPDVSQTLIITRMAGRTPVPERESIRKLAEHGSSMAIFLSSSMLDDLTEELLAGGYHEDTPAAIVYKASWVDEVKVVTTLSNIAKVAKEKNITKTALILVGDFLGDEYSRSKLYHPAFTHGFRKGKE